MAQSPSIPDAGGWPAPAFRDRKTWTRLAQAVRVVARSEIGKKFQLLFAALLVLLVGINGLNVASSYVGRDLMTAIEQHSASRFFSMALLNVVVFAVLTATAVVL